MRLNNFQQECQIDAYMRDRSEEPPTHILPDHLSELAAALQRLARGVSVKVAALFQTGATCFRAPSR
jgi:hypothetical protein